MGRVRSVWKTDPTLTNLDYSRAKATPPHPYIKRMDKEAACEGGLGRVGSELRRTGCNEVDAVSPTQPNPVRLEGKWGRFIIKILLENIYSLMQSRKLSNRLILMKIY